ncbi:indolepyruvate oxidoreductase subunit beta [Sedimentisphaera salicampi]|uniref:indolepyruvate oxidoreductase subunit beta n=1 Tax=Sedimentisphaera salicampi TaxID=1941349 RepID=UPI000B9B8259|nr:indolepyruvate oxidoreductase subunit beta [Sedimentisphaera salicampi]OXU14513.1 indolepyruvate oxidoreductase subunit beta [Sedimentisphaera salicampi]
MSDTTSVVLAGVGGQGILLASEIVAQAAKISGFDVKTNEVHGMAQRGGSVIAHVRFGEKVYSPLAAKGEAKVLGGLERISALRYADYLCEGGLVAVNSQMMVPVTVSMGMGEYPADAEKLLRDKFENLIYINASEEARKLGNVRAANVVLLGALSKGLDKLSEEAWLEAVKISVKPKFIDLNIKAFKTGREI